MRYAVLVVWTNGDEEYVCKGVNSEKVASFTSKRDAQEMADFMHVGMDKVQSISVVKYPGANANG